MVSIARNAGKGVLIAAYTIGPWGRDATRARCPRSCARGERGTDRTDRTDRTIPVVCARGEGIDYDYDYDYDYEDEYGDEE